MGLPVSLECALLHPLNKNSPLPPCATALAEKSGYDPAQQRLFRLRTSGCPPGVLATLRHAAEIATPAARHFRGSCRDSGAGLESRTPGDNRRTRGDEIHCAETQPSPLLQSARAAA